jgi:hypothetical protein
MVKMKDTSVPAVVLNPAILALAAFCQDQLDLSLSVILLFVFLSSRPVAMIPFAFVLSRVIVFSVVMPVDIAFRPAISVAIFGLLSTTTTALNQFGFFVNTVEISLFDFTLS